LHLTQLGCISVGESVLQGDTGRNTDVGRGVVVGEFLTQGDKVGSLETRRKANVSGQVVLGVGRISSLSSQLLRL
jgi:hypothetical protein